MLSYIAGVISTILIFLISQLIIYKFGRKAAEDDRRRDFDLKLYGLKIEAAQKAYQYVVRVYRAYKIPGLSSDPKKVNLEARDWFDGQALLLGEKVYESLIHYLFSLESPDLKDEEHAKALVKAQNAIKSILKERTFSS